MKMMIIIIDLIFSVIDNVLSFVLGRRKLKNDIYQRHINRIKQKLINYYRNNNINSDKPIETSKISVIIPCYNEEKHIIKCIESILTDNNVEIIVSDGGSNDNTINILENKYSSKIKILFGGYNRGECQNVGYNISSGELVLFLHADTILPIGWGHALRYSLSNHNILLSSYKFSLDKNVSISFINYMLLYIIELFTNIRAQYLSLPYGDQGFGIKREIFEIIGKFQEIPLMEDYEFINLVNKLGKIDIITLPIVTSSRRWTLYGAITNTLLNQIVLFGRYMDIPYDKLAVWYYGNIKKKDY